MEMNAERYREMNAKKRIPGEDIGAAFECPLAEFS